MNISDLFHETTSALLGNKVRSSLTILGIVIGIASVIAMLAVGAGASGQIQASIQSLGSNLIVIVPGAQTTGVVSAGRGTSQTLTLSDVAALQAQIPDAIAVVPEVTTRTQVIAGASNTNTTIDGTSAEYTMAKSLAMDQGSFFTDQQGKTLSRVAILGPTTRDDLFGVGATDVVGKTIKIKNILFTVIGIAVSKGGTGFTNTDDRIYIPYQDVQLFLTGNQYVTDINIEAASASAMTNVQNEATTIMLAQHHITNPALADFSAVNQADIVSAASSVTNTLTYLLASVAGISLIVGGIGIMNMMLTTVTERTREIGLRKAIGAKKKDITLQFLVEAVMLTFIGGFIGIVLGWSIAFGISLSGILQATVSAFSIVLAFGVSALIGIIFGYYPARRAAGLNPIEALRYE